MPPSLVLITGASRGLGRALARAVPFEARVVDVSRSGAGDLPHLAADLSTEAGWAAFEDGLGRELDRFDGDRVVLIHNAGTLDPTGFAGEVDGAAYRRNVLLNSAAAQVIGHLYLAAVRQLRVRRELVMLSSGAASSVYPGWSAYGAGKAALDHWVRTVGAEQRLRGGVRVLAVAPGVVATDMQERIRAQDAEDFPSVERFRRLHDEGALRDAADVADQLWALLDRRPDNGAVLDLRDV